MKIIRSSRRAAALGLTLLATASLAACGGSSGDAGSGSGGDGPIAVSLITKESTNPFFVAMQKGAKAEAEKEGVQLTVGAGKEDGDEQGQVQLIENAIAAGQKGIIITPNGPGVNSAIKKARDAGLYVIALDTPPDPADTVDITFATDNFKAGELIGQWTKGQLAGKPATIALLDAFNDKVVTVDYNRDQGFLTGMGINTADPKKNGDEAPTGNYDGGQYTIVCNEPTLGAEDGGRTAMENCLTKNPDINVVYTINEPAATGAYNALKAAGKTDALIVSVDGGCTGVKEVTDGIIGATSQQYPLKMAELGVKAIAAYAKDGTKPTTSPGLDFYDTGVTLVTDKPATGVDSITSAEGSKVCWGWSCHDQRPSAPKSAAEELARRQHTLLQRVQHLLHSNPAISPALLLVIAVIVFTTINPNFAQPNALSLLVQQTAIVAALAIGQTLIILTAGIDLSVGAITILSTMLAATLAAQNGVPGFVALLIGIVVGVSAGALNGWLVTRVNLPPFIVTLGTLSIFTAIALLYSGGQSIQGDDLPPSLNWTGEAIRPFGPGSFYVTTGVVIVALLYAVVGFALSQTAWGRHVYAVGDDAEAARLAGIRVKRVLLSVYTTAGLLYGITAWVLIGRAGAASPNAIADANLQSITAVVIGGTSLFGGRGGVLGTLIGALIVQAFATGLSLAGVDDQYRVLTIGVLVIAAVSVDQWIRKVKA